MQVNRICIISPPFYSHFNPLLTLAKGFKKRGIEVIVGCSKEFEREIISAGLAFKELNISKNRNTGKAEETVQPDSESQRLNEFFQTTHRGAVETLIVQSEHRKADMLADPEQMIKQLQSIDVSLSPDLYIVDILSYGVTLALMALDLDFITFCPPHPYTIPEEKGFYGIPRIWPEGIQVEEEKVDKLKRVSKATEKEFTDIFNRTLEKYDQKEKIVKNAFCAVSPLAIIYNYLDFYFEEKEALHPLKIYMGHAFDEEPLDVHGKEKINQSHPVILITLGTFLSNRLDVLEKIIQACLAYNPLATLIVAAGENVDALSQYQNEHVFIESFIPQIALMPYVDVVIFHGGCNTFTEALYYGKPMILLPFSSDQFNIAKDVQTKGLAQVLDPNHLNEEEMISALHQAIDTENSALKKWQKKSQSRGPLYAVDRFLKRQSNE